MARRYVAIRYLAELEALSSVDERVMTVPGRRVRRDRRENNGQSSLDTQRGSQMSESDLGPPAPDLAEQQREVTDEADEEQDPLPSEPVHLPLDVNEADAMEQYREVGLDEDDYR
jgi:hypothetical protein